MLFIIYIYIYVHISSKIVHTKSYCLGYGFVILMDKKNMKKIKERREKRQSNKRDDEEKDNITIFLL